MSNLSNTPGGGDLPDRYRNVGEQIKAFFDFAENNPDRAVPFFVNIWETQASLTTRALALQGLGVAAKHYLVKEAFADWDVLKDIAKEVKGKGEVSNDLTRWAAAKALEDIGYSRQSLQHLKGGAIGEELPLIRQEICDRKLAEINKIPRLNSRGQTTVEYKRHLDFWLYGPADELLNGNENSGNYQDLIGDVISKLHGRGVYLGLISPNSIVQGAALRQAGLIFKESAEIEEYLYGMLEEFLHNSDREISFRINAAEIISTATDLSRRLKTLSKLLLEETELRNTAVRLLNPYKQELARVESDAYTVLDTLNFEYRLDKPEPKDLTIPQIESIIAASNRELDVISHRFATALCKSELLGSKYEKSAWVVGQLFHNKQDEYQADIETLIQKLNAQKSQTLEKQRKIESNQLLLKEGFLFSYNLGVKSSSNLAYLEQDKGLTNSNLAYLEQYKGLTNTDYNDFTYSQCQKRLAELAILKKNIIESLNQEKIKSEGDKQDRVLILAVWIIFLWIPGFIASVVILQNLFPSDSLGWLRAGIFFVIFIIPPLLFLFKLDVDRNRKNKKINLTIEKLNEQWI